MEGKGKREEGRKTEMKKWREVPGAVADPGEGSKGPKKKSFETGRPPPPPPPSQGVDDPTPTPISEVWIRHWREREREGEKNGWKERKKGRHEGRKKLRER